MMKKFLATASITLGLALALLFIPGGTAYTQEKFDGTQCDKEYAHVYPWTETYKAHLYRTLKGPEDISLFHEALAGRPTQEEYDELRMYVSPNESRAALILYKDGCVAIVAPLPKEILAKAIVKYEEIKRGT